MALMNLLGTQVEVSDFIFMCFCLERYKLNFSANFFFGKAHSIQNWGEMKPSNRHDLFLQNSFIIVFFLLGYDEATLG